MTTTDQLTAALAAGDWPLLGAHPQRSAPALDLPRLVEAAWHLLYDDDARDDLHRAGVQLLEAARARHAARGAAATSCWATTWP